MTLLVSADAVATRLRIPLPLSEPVRADIEDAITDAQADVQGYLGRSLEATLHTDRGLEPDTAWPLGDKRAWPQAAGHFNDRYRVVSWVANAQDPGLFDVTFAVGLDVGNDPDLAPIVRFITRSAMQALRASATFAEAARGVTSVSAGGQSLSYDHASTADGAAGSLPNIKTLSRWRRHNIGQSGGPLAPRWPYARGYGR